MLHGQMLPLFHITILNLREACTPNLDLLLCLEPFQQLAMVDGGGGWWWVVMVKNHFLATQALNLRLKSRTRVNNMLLSCSVLTVGGDWLVLPLPSRQTTTGEQPYILLPHNPTLGNHRPYIVIVWTLT